MTCSLFWLSAIQKCVTTSNNVIQTWTSQWEKSGISMDNSNHQKDFHTGNWIHAPGRYSKKASPCNIQEFLNNVLAVIPPLPQQGSTLQAVGQQLGPKKLRTSEYNNMLARLLLENIPGFPLPQKTKKNPGYQKILKPSCLLEIEFKYVHLYKNIFPAHCMKQVMTKPKNVSSQDGS